MLAVPRPSVERSLLGALVVTFAVSLAIDAARNAVVVSYGMIWGVPVVGALRAVDRLVPGWWRRRAAAGRSA